MTKKTVAFLAVCVACQNALYAGEPSERFYTTDEVVVTGSHFSEKEKESARFITVADSEKLKKTGATNAIEALSRIGGLGYKSLAPLGVNKLGMNSSVYIRGMADGELILVNGMPVQQAASKGYDLSAISIDQIERIEVLKGAASTLYGADAMSGVINIVTKKPSGETSATASVEFGNESWMNHGVSVNLPGATIGFRYQHMGELDNVGRQFTNNYTNALDETDRYMFSLNLSPFADTYIDYQYSGYETGFIDRYDSGLVERTDQQSDFHFLNVRYESDVFKAKLYGVYDNRVQTEYVDGVFESEVERLNYNYGAETDYRFLFSRGFELSVGADYVHRYAEYSNIYGEKSRDDYGVFAELKKRFGDDLILTFGGREQFIDNEAETTDYNVFLPSVGLMWKASDDLNLFANAGKAFQAPTFTQLYYDSKTIKGNPDLKPESGWSYETGFKWNCDCASARVSGFWMTYDDKIQIDRKKKPYRYFNAGAYETKGIEWELGLRPFYGEAGILGRVSLSAAGYWADPVSEDIYGEKYQPGPKFQNTFGITYASIPFGLDLRCRILAGRQDNLDNYTAFDLSGRVKAGPGNVTVAVENLFDTEIQTSGNLVETASSRYVYYDPGRLLRVGYAVAL